MLPPDLPPVSNRFTYAYRIFAKWLSFFVFGLGSLVLTILVFPPMRLFLHPRERFTKYARRFVSSSLGGFVTFMHIIGIVDLDVESRDAFKQLSSKIIVVNHPSLLDVVMMFSLISNADCVVQGYINDTILRGIVRQLYILTSLEFDDILEACSETLKQGNCLIVFPEGTRTPRSGKVIVKRGAARIAIASGFNIVPVHIGGTDKYGLGKKDPWASFNPRERYVYRVRIKPEISPEKYRELPMPKAVRALTREITASLFPARQAEEDT